MPREWYEEYFDEVYLEVYGAGVERAAQEVDFMAQALGLGPGAAVLDLCCGPGRHAVELARRGYSVAGLDRSRVLLAKAEELARAAGVRVELVEEDMRTVPETWAARFDAAINVFTSWGYFESEAEDEKAIAALARSLKLGGRFLLDTINHERTVRKFRSSSWREAPGGLLLLDATELDLLRGRIETLRTIARPDGARLQRRLSIRSYTLAEVRGILARHALKVTATYGDFSGRLYTMDSPRMIVVAERAR